jgi:chromosome segregation ATPase|tara:strand:- start:609 stop:1271 length:663 start_codon:yes stop_codon:yes gene_type:complete
MAGFVGERARKKRRNTLIFLSILLIVILYFFINPRIQLNENIPTDDFLPKENEIIEPNFDSTIEELELKIFDKEQKIIFRDKQIKVFKEDILNHKIEIKKLSKLVTNLEDQLKLDNREKDQIKTINNDISKIKLEAKQEIEKLNKTLFNINEEKKLLQNSLVDSNNENDVLLKEYKIISNKNIKLNNQKKELQKQINELENLIEEQNLLIKVLQDTSHHQ